MSLFLKFVATLALVMLCSGVDRVLLHRYHAIVA